MSKVEIKSAAEWDAALEGASQDFWNASHPGFPWYRESETTQKAWRTLVQNMFTGIGLSRPEPEMEIIPCPEDVIEGATEYANQSTSAYSAYWYERRANYIFSAGVAHEKASKQ